eukprot:12927469-Heterocapsa_arctica.AAC.1
MEESRALGNLEQGNKTSASSSERPLAQSGSAAARRKRAGEPGSARETRNPESFRGPGPPT